MAIYNAWDIEAQPASASPNYAAPFVVRAVFDASKQNLSAGDDVRMVKLPDNTIITAFAYRIETAEGAADDIDIGTTQNGTDLADINDASATNSGNWVGTDLGTCVDTTAAPSYIWLNAVQALTTVRIHIMAVCVMANNAESHYGS